MPLKPGKKNIGNNIKEMESSGHSRDQSIAAALENARRHPFASGGAPKFHPDNVVREQFHIGGLFHGATPGRADKVPVSVPAKSYVVPADVVSGVGQGNTAAGAKVLDNMFGTPYGVKAGGHAGGIGIPKPPHINVPAANIPAAGKGLAAGGHMAHGGSGESSQPGFVPIYASHGEYLVHPEQVKKLGDGDIDHGHDILDKWVVLQRKKNVEKTKKLAPPVGSKKK